MITSASSSTPAALAPAGPSPRVAAILLNWNNGRFTIPCIESLLADAYPSLEIWVVDNGSQDDSPDQIEIRFPEVHVIRNRINVGFAEGNNVGMRAALEQGADYLLVLNNDTIVSPGMIAELVAVLQEHGNRAIASPKMFWQEPADRLWYGGSRANLWLGLFRHVNWGKPDPGDCERSREAAFATGCCILLPREVVAEVGMFDPEFFLYWEDADLSLRCRRAGYRVLYVPGASLWHVGSGTMGADSTPQRRDDRALRQHYLYTRNNIWAMRRNAPRLPKHVFLVLLPARVVWRLLPLLAAGNWKAMAAQWKGTRDGLSRRF
ncbi:MAG: glycosyltransferase family 2 protein [Terriglobales bacterium]